MPDHVRPNAPRKVDRQRPSTARGRGRPPAAGPRRPPTPPAPGTLVAAAQRFTTPRQRLSRRAAHLLGWVAIIAAVVAAGWGLSLSPLLQVHTVAVSGVEGAAQSAVRSATAAQVGTPLLQVDTDQVAASISSGGAYESVRVTRSWPQTLQVAVVPRTPAVQVRTAAGGYAVFDRRGDQYLTAPEPLSGVPVAVVKNPQDADAVRAVVATMQAVPEDLRREVRDVTVVSAVDVRFMLGSVSVKWGGPEDGETKAKLVGVLRQRSGVATIDVSSPSMPVTT